MSKKVLYMDNSCLRAIHYNLNNHSLKTIEKAVKAKEIEILSNMILENEVLEHCENMIQSDIERIMKDSTLDTFLKNELDSLRKKIKGKNSSDFLSKFKKNFSPINIDSDVDWRIVFSKYFKREAPFSQKKKDEFPDAFVIEMLKLYKDKNLHIVSGDNDFYVWANEDKQMSAYRSLKEFTDYFIKSKKSYLIDFYDKKNKGIKAKIKKYLIDKYNENDEFETESYHSEITYSDVQKLGKIKNVIVSEDLKENSIEVEYSVNAKVYLEISSDVVHYDSIDKDEMHMGTNNNSITKDVFFEGKLKIYFSDKGKIIEYEFYDEVATPSTIDIDPDWEYELGDEHFYEE